MAAGLKCAAVAVAAAAAAAGDRMTLLSSGLWDLCISVTFRKSFNSQRHICGGREPGGESLFLTDGQRQPQGDRLVLQSFAPSCLTWGIMMWKRGGDADPTKSLSERQTSSGLRGDGGNVEEPFIGCSLAVKTLQASV